MQPYVCCLDNDRKCYLEFAFGTKLGHYYRYSDAAAFSSYSFPCGHPSRLFGRLVSRARSYNGVRWSTVNARIIYVG